MSGLQGFIMVAGGSVHAAMLLVALWSLAAFTIAFETRCPRVYEPLNKTILRLERLNRPLTWLGAHERCAQEFPGFELLGRELLGLPAASAALCRNQSVPFGVTKTGLGPILWHNGPGDKYLQAEEVNSTYLGRKRGKEAKNASVEYRGALNLSTSTWSFVGKNVTFRCVLCQRAWLFWLGLLKLSSPDPPNRPAPFQRAYAVVIQKTGDDNGTAVEFIDYVEDTIDCTFGNVSIEVTAIDLTHLQRHSLRILSSDSLDADLVSLALNVSHEIVSWQDMDFCQTLEADGLMWEKSRIGRVLEIRLPEFRLATRACTFRWRRDGDFDATWNDVYYWLDHEARCLATPDKTLLSEIHDLVTKSANDSSLSDLVALTDSLRHLQWPNGVPGVNNRKIVLEDTASILNAKLQDSGYKSDSPIVCNISACAFVFKERVLESPSLILLKRGDYAMFWNHTTSAGDRNGINEENLMNFDMLIEVPSQPQSMNGMVAGHLFQDHDFNVFYQARPGVWFTYWTAVVLQIALTDVSRSVNDGRPPLSVTFRIKRRSDGLKLERFWAAWSFGDGYLAPKPCLMVRSETLWDVYNCKDFSSRARNLTEGSFLGYSGLEAWTNRHVSVFPDVASVAELLHRYTQLVSDRSLLELVSEVIDQTIAMDFSEQKDNFTARNAIYEDLESIVDGTHFTEKVITVGKPRVKIVVSNLTSRDPVVGFSLNVLAGDGGVELETITTERNVSRESAVDVVMSSSMEMHCERCAFLAVTDFTNFYSNGSIGAHIKKKLMVVHVVINLRSGVDVRLTESFNFDFQLNVTQWAGSLLSTENGDTNQGEEEEEEEEEEDTVDEAANSDSEKEVSAVHAARKLRVAVWNDGTNDWATKSCVKRKSTRGLKLVYRCSDIIFEGNKFTGRYMIFEVYQFTDYLSGALLSILVAAGILSSVSLTSIAATAISLASWRQDLGHKILLQMSLAISFNLASGFTSSLVSVDTASAACIVVGAFRHFSYLAMFAWMLIMSGLQLKRLLTVLGARTTLQLLLKVSVFAWGLPFVAVAALLLHSTDTYRSDVADRGFCYPEGTVFEWTVQAPAAAILVMNALIFAVILARVYTCWGWGKTEDLRRHLNERTFQLRRLRAVFFIFCLFGLAWVFHLLAEQGVFQQKFLYEYLFLMTASVHIFSLCSIFVLFDTNTREEWKVVLIKRKTEWFS